MMGKRLRAALGTAALLGKLATVWRLFRAEAQRFGSRGGAEKEKFRAKTQRHEEVALAAKRLSPSTSRRAAWFDEQRAWRPEPSSLRLCVFARKNLCDLCASERICYFSLRVSAPPREPFQGAIA
jgi:hypothetical protein